MRTRCLQIIVVGLGEVGRDVARILEAAGHRVTSIDTRSEAFDTFNDVDIAFVSGNGASPRILRIADVAKTDLLIACTSNDEVNLIAALIGKRLGAKMTISRLHSSAYEDLDASKIGEVGIHYDMLGIDFVVNPRVLVTDEMIHIARSHGALDVHFFGDRQIELAEMRVNSNSIAVGKTLSEIKFPIDTLVGAVIRDGRLFVPRGDSSLELDDRVYLFGRTDRINAAEDLLSRGHEAASVAIYGDKDISKILARGLTSQGIRTLLIVDDREQAQSLAEDLPKTTVLNASGSDLAMLSEEQIGRYDIYFAVTQDDENNLMSGLLAKRLGVDRVVCLVQKRSFADIYRELGIDVVLSPTQIAADQIASFVRTDAVEAVVHLNDGKAQIIEVVAAEKSPITKKPLRDLSLPTGVSLGGIIRNGTVIIPHGNCQVEAGDLVVVMTLSKMRGKVEKLFKKGFF